MGRAFEFRKARKMKRWSAMAKTFTRIGKDIVIAVKEGGPSPETNARLRAVIQNAKAANMPKENVERAIKKASDKDTANYKEVLFEGYAPHGKAILIETATDTNNRTVANIRSYFYKCNGTLGSPASVSARQAPRDYTPRHLRERILQSRSALEGERKQVSVLFADIRGSMELAAQLDPEQWHQLLEGFFAILAEGVHRFEGTINQYTGDGIMALFGAPIAHDDHAQRACYAALHLQQQVARYAIDVRREHGVGFSTRMGINSGEVVVGRIGDDLRMDYTAQGPTVGLAQRMESLAEPNTCYVAPATAALVRGYLALEDLGAFRVKGLAERIPVHRLAGIGEARTRLDVSRQRGLSQFVGRAADLRLLQDALARAADGGALYQVAFEQLKALVDGAASVNAVIREAVLKARTVPTNVDLGAPHALARLEASSEGWRLGPAVKALGLLIARHVRHRFGRAVLTTNFDPLIELAIRAAGGHAHAIAQLGDGVLSAPDPVVTSVVHLHGMWRGDTLHTPGALTVDRAALRSSLARLYQEVTLVVMAYGGWDDVLTKTLADLAVDPGTTPDILWCFFEPDSQKLAERDAKLLALVSRSGERVSCYAGIDCNVVLPKLRAAVDGEGELLRREAVCDQLFDALDSEHAVEIIGGPHMRRKAR